MTAAITRKKGLQNILSSLHLFVFVSTWAATKYLITVAVQSDHQKKLEEEQPCSLANCLLVDGSKNEVIILWLVFPLDIAVVKSCKNNIFNKFEEKWFFCKCKKSKQNYLKRQNVVLRYELRSDYSDPYDQNLN